MSLRNLNNSEIDTHEVIVNVLVKDLRDTIVKQLELGIIKELNKKKVEEIMKRQCYRHFLCSTFSETDISEIYKRVIDYLLNNHLIREDYSRKSTNLNYVVVEQELEEQTYTDDYVQE